MLSSGLCGWSQTWAILPLVRSSVPLALRRGHLSLRVEATSTTSWRCRLVNSLGFIWPFGDDVVKVMITIVYSDDSALCGSSSSYTSRFAAVQVSMAFHVPPRAQFDDPVGRDGSSVRSRGTSRREQGPASSEEQALGNPFAGPALQDIGTISSVGGLQALLRSSLLLRSDTTAVFLAAYKGFVPGSVSTLARSFGCLPEVIVLLNFVRGFSHSRCR